MCRNCPSPFVLFQGLCSECLELLQTARAEAEFDKTFLETEKEIVKGRLQVMTRVVQEYWLNPGERIRIPRAFKLLPGVVRNHTTGEIRVLLEHEAAAVRDSFLEVELHALDRPFPHRVNSICLGTVDVGPFTHAVYVSFS